MVEPQNSAIGPDDWQARTLRISKCAPTSTRMGNELLNRDCRDGTVIALPKSGTKEASYMDEQEKLKLIKKSLEEIAAQIAKMSKDIERLKKELERIKPPRPNGN